MMRIFRFYIALVLVSILSCCARQERVFVSEEAERQGMDEGAQVTMTCTFAGQTRVVVSEDGKTCWEPGDEILVHGEGKNNRVTVTLAAEDISSDGKHATITFTGVKPYDRSADRGYLSTYYAAYPAEAVLAENLYYYARFGETNHPLMAAYNDGDELVFYNLCGVISFRVSGDYDSYTFSGNGGETVGYSRYQSYLVMKGDGTPRLDYNYTSDNGTSGPLTSLSGTVVADGTTPNYVCLPNGTAFSAGFTLTLKKGSDTRAVATTAKSVTVGRGLLLPLGDITDRLEIRESPSNHCRDEYLGERPMVIAYLTEYTSSSSLEASHVTHINYAHGRFKNPSTGDGGIVISGTDLLQKVLALKKKRPTLKVLLMIGGWGEKADGFSMMARDPAKRTEFCQACKAHVDTYGLDGIDIDWEYPGGGPSSNGQSKDDAANFNLVLKELRETLGDTKIISFASSSSAGYVDWSGAMEYLDYINVMTYDMGKPPYHNSTLYHSALTRSTSCEESVEKHRKAGVPLDRQNLGVPFYGHGISPYAEDVKFREMSAILSATSGTYAGKNIRRWDDIAKVPYLVDGDGTMLLGYDDAESVAWKGRFVLEKGLLGAMFWEYRHDDDAGTLRKSLYNAIYAKD